jgi:hypothetical protein
MSKQPFDNASVSIKRKRAPVWPFATRDLCEQVVKLLIEDDLVRELSPPDEWRIHPSTEARGKGFQHERRLWVTNDLNAWHIAKLRQHAQDPTKQTGRTGFEGGFVSRLNSSFAELLRRLIRGGGRTPAEIPKDSKGAPQGPPGGNSSLPDSRGKGSDVSQVPSSGEGGGRLTAGATAKPRGGPAAAAAKGSSAEGSNRLQQELDSWENYSNCV